MDSEVISQFLPSSNIQYAWDSTSLGDLKKCPLYYWYTHIEGYTTKEENVHLRFGSEVHEAFHDYELNRVAGIEHDEAVFHTVTNLLDRIYEWEPDVTTKAANTKNKDTLLRTVIWYLDKYQDDPAETIILDNGKPAIEVSFKWELDYGPRGATNPYILCGHLDRVVRYPRNSDDLFIMDRKTTTSALTQYYFSQFEPNNQMTLYSLSSQVVINSPVKAVMIDAMQVKEEETLFGRAFTYRTPAQLEEWLKDLRYWLVLAESFAQENHWPMNDTACTMYGGCRFREICAKSPSQRQKFLNGNYVKRPREERWNPLKAR